MSGQKRPMAPHVSVGDETSSTGKHEHLHMSITAGILSWNRKDDLRRTLDAVLALDLPGLLVHVIDNGSTDGTIAMLDEEYSAERYPALMVTKLPDNTGNAARNLFFKMVDTDYLLTLDDDSWPRSEADVLRMLRTMESDERIATVCAACIHPDTKVAETRGIERFASRGDRETGYDVVNIAAGGTLLRMAAMRETRGYDPEFFWGRVENDLAFQLLKKNWRIVFDPEAVIWHSFSPVGRNPYPRLRAVTQNSFSLLWKHIPLPFAIPGALLFALRRLLPAVRDYRRLKPVAQGIVSGWGGMLRQRRRDRRFSMRGTFELRHWFAKFLYE